MNWKFRGLDINGKWYYGNLTIIETIKASISQGYYISNSVGMPYAYKIRPETATIFSGIKDKNGVEIYEGDRLGHRLNIVEFSNGCFNTNGDRPLYHQTGLEIAGNIFENVKEDNNGM